MVFVEDLDSPEPRDDDAHHLGEVLRSEARRSGCSRRRGRLVEDLRLRLVRPARSPAGGGAPRRPLRSRGAGPVHVINQRLAGARGRLLVGQGGADRVGGRQIDRARRGPHDAARRGPDGRATRPGPAAAPRGPASQDRAGGGDAVPPALPPRDRREPEPRRRRRSCPAGRSRSPSLAATRSRSRRRSCWSVPKVAGQRAELGDGRPRKSRSETASCGSRQPRSPRAPS